MAVTDIGIDMGSMYIRVYVRNRGIVLEEPQIAAYDKDREKFVSYGEEAMQTLSRGAGNLVAVRPFRHGTITDYAVLEEVLRYLIKRSIGRRALRKPSIAVSLPGEVTAVEKHAIEEASYQAGARSVVHVKGSVATAIGAGIDITKPVGNMIVDIGGGKTDIALLSVGAPVNGTTIRVAGKAFDDAIMRYVRRKHSLFINESEAEHIKREIGCAVKRPNSESMDIAGRNVITGLPATISITQEEVRNALSDPVGEIVEAIHGILEKTPPELAQDVVERGIVLAGGGSLLAGMEERISERTGINVMTAEHPERCAAIGAGRYAEIMQYLETF